MPQNTAYGIPRKGHPWWTVAATLPSLWLHRDIAAIRFPWSPGFEPWFPQGLPLCRTFSPFFKRKEVQDTIEVS